MTVTTALVRGYAFGNFVALPLVAIFVAILVAVGRTSLAWGIVFFIVALLGTALSYVIIRREGGFRIVIKGFRPPR